MDVLKRVNQLMEERKWSYYRLAEQSGLSSSTIANMYRRNTTPSIATLEALCSAFGITLSQFFSEDNEDVVFLTPEQKAFFEDWYVLTAEQKFLIENIVKQLKKD